MIEMIIAMIMVSLTTLKKPKLLFVSSTQSARTFKGNPFLIFNLKTSRISNCLSSNGTKFQIFGCRKDSDELPC